MEEWIESKKVYDGRIIAVRVGDVRMDDGTVAFREVIEHPGGVAVVPVLGDSVILVRQYRVAIGKEILELPAGKLEGVEDPEERGRRELEEEAGYRAGRMVHAGNIYASVGYTSELIRLYLALDLEETQQDPEADECIEIVRMPIAQIEALIERNELQDAKTIVGLQALLAYIRKEHGR